MQCDFCPASQLFGRHPTPLPPPPPAPSTQHPATSPRPRAGFFKAEQKTFASPSLTRLVKYKVAVSLGQSFFGTEPKTVAASPHSQNTKLPCPAAARRRPNQCCLHGAPCKSEAKMQGPRRGEQRSARIRGVLFVKHRVHCQHFSTCQAPNQLDCRIVQNAHRPDESFVRLEIILKRPRLASRAQAACLGRRLRL